MKAIILGITFFLSTIYANSQISTGVYSTYEDYANNTFSKTDTFVTQSWNFISGDKVTFHNGSKKYKLTGEMAWGYKDNHGWTSRFCLVKKVYRALRILKEAPICVYGLMFSYSEKDENGNLIKISCSDSNSPEFYISKTITGEVLPLNEENIKALIYDNSALEDAVNSGEYNDNKGKLSLLSVINSYNSWEE